MRKYQWTPWVVTRALLFGGFLMIPAICSAKGDSAEINKLLADANSHAIQFRADSEKMTAFAHAKSGWENYATQLQSIKEHVNATGKVLASLKAARDSGSLWQQTAIDRITPLLKEMATNTETVIATLNKNQRKVHLKEFQDYVQANYDVASELSHVISDFVDYGNTKIKLERLAAKLEIE